MLLTTIKILFKTLAWLILILIILFFIIYAVAPVYKFPEYEAFSGDKIYNPYKGMDSTAWKKANFQVQSRVWLGITNGRHNTNEAIQIIYKQLGYDFIVTSDYMTINTFGAQSKRYIPTYEHGYGIRKTHQVCIGSEKVNWVDYPFYQNISHKQHIINILQRNNDIVALAHPDLRDGYLPEEMKKLTNYDLIEVMNEARMSFNHWDAALSSGHSSFILANDDAHDIFDPTEVGRICTFINTQSLEAEDVLDALKNGNAFGADIAMRKGADFVEKANDHKHLPVLQNVSVANDTLWVKVSGLVKLFSFIGQDGVLKKTVADTTLAAYAIQPSDTYIRTEIVFHNNVKYYLNPVFRYSGNKPADQPHATVDLVKTWVQRGLALIFSIILILVVSRLKKGKQNKGKINRRPNYYYSR